MIIKNMLSLICVIVLFAIAALASVQEKVAALSDQELKVKMDQCAALYPDVMNNFDLEFKLIRSSASQSSLHTTAEKHFGKTMKKMVEKIASIFQSTDKHEIALQEAITKSRENLLTRNFDFTAIDKALDSLRETDLSKFSGNDWSAVETDLATITNFNIKAVGRYDDMITVKTVRQSGEKIEPTAMQEQEKTYAKAVAKDITGKAEHAQLLRRWIDVHRAFQKEAIAACKASV